ncbi:hypothetical protein [Simiduia aestuariiviva]|uniref:Lipopolysaccharide biosynthesis regulator YciM n=1 Tax=Simiduia aestuariiviva TaxID=1510459 RepID=A0A839ULV6_9GAMM|nr:hypothetical protein [Simiduia aestuariiviva]MBB3167529.1 lipopolysaccharide biosynthesis regulator YciM [Simiduia aestuariiviva]
MSEQSPSEQPPHESPQRDRIKRLVSEVKSELNHAGAKLGDLDEQMHEVAERLSRASEVARLQAHLAAMDSKAALISGRQKARTLAQRALRNSHTQWDHLVLQAHLAKMDLGSFVEGPGAELVRGVKTAGRRAEHELHLAMREMSKHMDDIAQHMRREV